MRLTPQEVEFFKRFSTTNEAKMLLAYLEKVRKDVFNPAQLTKDNLEAKKDAVRIIQEMVEDRIKFAGEDKTNDVNEYS